MQQRTLLLCAALACSACTANTVTPDAATTSLTIQGSDTEVQLVSNLAEAFAIDHPEVDMSVTGGGSAVGIAALINGETDIANSSRQMKDEEMKQAAEKGIDVQEFVLARDGLSVIVHPTNAVTSLTVAEIGAIFRGETTNWKDVVGADAPVVLYGRQSTSGTFGFFRDTVLKGDYSDTMRQMEGSQAIVDGVANDANGIGYVGVGYIKDNATGGRSVIAVTTVSPEEGQEAVSPLDKEAVMAGRYPIWRPIYQYLSALPEAGSILEQFLHFEMSEAGQRIIEEAGFYPLTDTDRMANDALLEAI